MSLTNAKRKELEKSYLTTILENNNVFIKDKKWVNLDDFTKNIVKSRNIKRYIKTFPIEHCKYFNSVKYVSIDYLSNMFMRYSRGKLKDIRDKILKQIIESQNEGKNGFLQKVDTKTNTILYGNNLIRYVKVDGKIWFVGADICKVLLYSDEAQALNNNCEMEDIKSYFELIQNSPVFHTTLKWTIYKSSFMINEYALLDLIISSKMPTAKKFRKWVTHDVLPSIMRSGKYDILENKDNDIVQENSMMKDLEIITGESIFYIIKVNEKIFKYGITDNGYERFNKHDKTYDGYQIVKIENIRNKSIGEAIERKFKKYLRSKSLHMYYSKEIKKYMTPEEKALTKIKNLSVELFQITKKYSLKDILDMLDIFIKEEFSKNSIFFKNSSEIGLILADKIITMKELGVNDDVISDCCNIVKKDILTDIDDIDDVIEESKNKHNKEEVVKKIIYKDRHKNKKCLDCDNLIYSTSTRCSNCSRSHLKKTLYNKHKSKKLYYCSECNTKVNKGSERCKKCYLKNKSINKKKYNCINCSKKISKGCTRCIECQKTYILEKSNMPSFEELKKDLYTYKTMIQIAIKYQTADNTVRKWIKKYNSDNKEQLPLRPVNHRYQKLRSS